MMLLLLFLFGATLDYLWFKCVRVADTGKAHLAAAYSAVYATLQLFSSWEIIKADSWAGFSSYVLGQALGAYLAVKRKGS